MQRPCQAADNESPANSLTFAHAVCSRCIYPPRPLEIAVSVLKASSAGLLTSSAPMRMSFAVRDTKSADLMMSSLMGLLAAVPSTGCCSASFINLAIYKTTCNSEFSSWAVWKMPWYVPPAFTCSANRLVHESNDHLKTLPIHCARSEQHRICHAHLHLHGVSY